MFGFILKYMKDNLDDVGQLDAPTLKADKPRRKGFPFSPDDRLSQAEALRNRRSDQDYEEQQYRFANSDHEGPTKVNRGAW